MTVTDGRVPMDPVAVAQTAAVCRQVLARRRARIAAEQADADQPRAEAS